MAGLVWQKTQTLEKDHNPRTDQPSYFRIFSLSGVTQRRSKGRLSMHIHDIGCRHPGDWTIAYVQQSKRLAQWRCATLVSNAVPIIYHRQRLHAISGHVRQGYLGTRVP